MGGMRRGRFWERSETTAEDGRERSEGSKLLGQPALGIQVPATSPGLRITPYKMYWRYESILAMALYG